MAKTRRVKKLRGGNQYGPDTPELMRRLQNIQNNELDVGGLNITSLPPLPPTLTHLDVSGTQLTSLPALPPTLNSLHAYETNITSLPPLPPTLTILDVSHTNIRTLPNIPPGLEHLHVGDTDIRRLPTLPPGLSSLHVHETTITSLPPLPPTLTELIVSGSSITNLPELPSTLVDLEIDDTNIPPFKENETIPQYNARMKARDLSSAQQTVLRPGTAAPPGSALEKVMNTNVLKSNITPMLTGKSGEESNVLPATRPTAMQELKKEVTGRYGGKTRKSIRRRT